MNALVELISIIRKRPIMYLGEDSISRLKSFIDGWCFRDPDNIADFEVLLGFQQWIENKYNVKTAHSWAHILLFYGLDESRALTLFFNEFDLYLLELK